MTQTPPNAPLAPIPPTLTDRYELSYSEAKKQVLALVVTPLLGTALLLGGLMALPRLPDWLVFPVICVGVIGLIAVTVVAFLRFALVSCELQMGQSGLRLQLKQNSFLYWFDTIQCSWDNIANVSRDDSRGKIFYRITFKQPHKTALLTLTKGDMMINLGQDSDPNPDFWQKLDGYVKNYNAAHAGDLAHQITRRGFYETTAARLLAVISLLMLIGFTIAAISGALTADTLWLKLITLYCFGLPFIGAVTSAWRKKSK